MCCGRYLGLRRRTKEETGKKYTMRSLMVVVLIKYYWDGQIKDDDMGSHVVLMNEKRYAYRDLVGKPKGKINLEDLSADGKIFKWILNMQHWTAWTGLIWF